jgi:hypothetical protein
MKAPFSVADLKARPERSGQIKRSITNATMGRADRNEIRKDFAKGGKVGRF